MDPLKIAIVYFLIAVLGLADGSTIFVFPGESIEGAIYYAKDGDVIEVHKGLYYEHITVNKQLVLNGIDMPILDATASGSAITVSADGTIIKGFRVINSDKWPGDWSDEAGIKILSNNNTIVGNNVSNNSNGILIIGGNNNTIKYNTVCCNLGFGIGIYNSKGNMIFNNSLYLNYKNNTYETRINQLVN
jgi:parallel beta-helix repeat protein